MAYYLQYKILNIFKLDISDLPSKYTHLSAFCFIIDVAEKTATSIVNEYVFPRIAEAPAEWRQNIASDLADVATIDHLCS